MYHIIFMVWCSSQFIRQRDTNSPSIWYENIPPGNIRLAPRKYGCLWPWYDLTKSLRWRHNDHAGVSNHQLHGCLLNRLFRRKSKKTSKLRVTGLCAGNSPGTGEFLAQMASYAEHVSIWWRHHVEYLLHMSHNRSSNTHNTSFIAHPHRSSFY